LILLYKTTFWLRQKKKYFGSLDNCSVSKNNALLCADVEIQTSYTLLIYLRK